jgi:hypothetical protein
MIFSNDKAAHLVAGVEWLQRFLVETRETQITNLDLARARDEDVGGLEIAMDDPVVVEVGHAVEELPQERFKDRERERGAR